MQMVSNKSQDRNWQSRHKTSNKATCREFGRSRLINRSTDPHRSFILGHNIYISSEVRSMQRNPTKNVNGDGSRSWYILYVLRWLLILGLERFGLFRKRCRILLHIGAIDTLVLLFDRGAEPKIIDFGFLVSCKVETRTLAVHSIAGMLKLKPRRNTSILYIRVVTHTYPVQEENPIDYLQQMRFRTQT